MRAIIKFNESHLHLKMEIWQALARQMWNLPNDGRKVEADFGAGNFDQINYDLDFSTSLRIDEYTDAYNGIPNRNFDDGISLKPYIHENKAIAFTFLKEPLVITERAFYVFVQYFVQNLPGEVSEDGGKTWLTAAQYYQQHQKVMALNAAEVEALTLAQAGTTSLEDEPQEGSDIEWT